MDNNQDTWLIDAHAQHIVPFPVSFFNVNADPKCMEWYYCINCIMLCDIGILPYDHSIPSVKIALCFMILVFCLMTTPFRLLTLYVSFCIMLDDISVRVINLQYALWHDGICIMHVDIPVLFRAITSTILLTSCLWTSLN